MWIPTTWCSGEPVLGGILRGPTRVLPGCIFSRSGNHFGRRPHRSGVAALATITLSIKIALVSQLVYRNTAYKVCNFCSNPEMRYVEKGVFREDLQYGVVKTRPGPLETASSLQEVFWVTRKLEKGSHRKSKSHR